MKIVSFPIHLNWKNMMTEGCVLLIENLTKFERSEILSEFGVFASKRKRL